MSHSHRLSRGRSEGDFYFPLYLNYSGRTAKRGTRSLETFLYFFKTPGQSLDLLEAKQRAPEARHYSRDPLRPAYQTPDGRPKLPRI